MVVCPHCHEGTRFVQIGNTFRCGNCKTTFKLEEVVAFENFRKVGKNVTVYPTAKIVNAENIELGDNVTVGDFCFVNGGAHTIIEDNSQLNAYSSIIGGGETYILNDVCISYYVCLISGTDTPSGRYMVDVRPLTERKVVRGKITIEQRAFIGAHVIIAVSEKKPTIKIGMDSVIAAGTFIGGDIPPNTIVIPKQKLIFKPRKVT